MPRGLPFYGNAYDQLGTSVAISAQGDILAIGAPQYRTNQQMGYVDFYQWNGTQWVRRGSRQTGATPRQNLGKKITLSDDGNRLIALKAANHSIVQGTGGQIET